MECAMLVLALLEEDTPNTASPGVDEVDVEGAAVAPSRSPTQAPRCCTRFLTAPHAEVSSEWPWEGG